MKRFSMDKILDHVDEPIVSVHVDGDVQVTVTACPRTGVVTVVAHDVAEGEQETMTLTLSDATHAPYR